MRKLGFGSLVLTLSCVLGCGQSNDHAKNLHNPGGTGGTGAGGTGGGSCQPNPESGVKVQGDMIVYDGLLNTEPLVGTAEIKIAGSPCGYASAVWDSNGPLNADGKNFFLLEGVLSNDQNWSHIYPQTTELALYPTLIAAVTVDALSTYEGGFGLVKADDVNNVYAATGVTYDPDKFGTIIVQTLDPLSGMPAWGVSVSAGSNAAVATADISGWKLGGETDQQGIAVLLNAKASAFPGMSLTITIETTTKQTYKCPAEKGAVTICWVAVGS